VQDKRYVDGGLLSPTNATVLENTALDLVLISAPLSCMAPLRFLLRRELRQLRRNGIVAVAIEPSLPVRKIIGWNVMDTERAPAVTHAARESVAEMLRQPALRDALRRLGA